MKQYKAGFELDDQEEVQKQSPDSSRTAGDDAGVADFSYKKGFTLDQEPEQARVITVSDVDPSNLTTLPMMKSVPGSGAALCYGY